MEEWGSCDKNKQRIFSVPITQSATGDIGGIILDDEVRSWSKKSPLALMAPTTDK